MIAVSFYRSVLEQYGLPTLSNLMASDIGKEQWKIMCKEGYSFILDEDVWGCF